MGHERTLCLDFDGVIHAYTTRTIDYQPHVILDGPTPGAMRFIEDAQNAGFTVAIYSSRSKSLRGRRAMKAWLDRHIIDHFGVDRVGADDCFSAIRWPWFKPPAFVTLDDRAITFNGTFPSIGEIKAFRPWNRRKS